MRMRMMTVVMVCGGAEGEGEALEEEREEKGGGAEMMEGAMRGVGFDGWSGEGSVVLVVAGAMQEVVKG